MIPRVGTRNFSPDDKRLVYRYSGGAAASELRVHRAAEHRDGLAQKRVRLGRRARVDDRAGAFDTHRQRLLHAPGQAFHRGFGNVRDHHRPRRRTGRFGRAHVCRRE